MTTLQTELWVTVCREEKQQEMKRRPVHRTRTDSWVVVVQGETTVVSEAEDSGSWREIRPAHLTIPFP